MTVEQVFYYYDLMVWELTGEPPAEYADKIRKAERWKAYPELAPESGAARVVSR
jgi:hypothetical protein